MGSNAQCSFLYTTLAAAGVYQILWKHERKNCKNGIVRLKRRKAAVGMETVFRYIKGEGINIFSI